jgi:hypothetical protein
MKKRYNIGLIFRTTICAQGLLFQGGHYLYVGFMCQQSIEKIFKAAYAKLKKETPPFTHDLVLLAEKSGLTICLQVNNLQFDAWQPLHTFARHKRVLKIMNHENEY